MHAEQLYMYAYRTDTMYRKAVNNGQVPVIQHMYDIVPINVAANSKQLHGNGIYILQLRGTPHNTLRAVASWQMCARVSPIERRPVPQTLPMLHVPQWPLLLYRLIVSPVPHTRWRLYSHVRMFRPQASR